MSEIEKSRLLIDYSEAKNLINERIESGKRLYDKKISSSEELNIEKENYKKWDSYNSELLKEIFNNTALAQEYDKNLYAGAWGGSRTLNEQVKEYKKDISKKINKLNLMKDKMKLYNDITSRINKIETKGETEMTLDKNIEKIFISHSSLDEKYATSLVRLLTDMKVPEDKIFCSSVKGYGVELGENFLEVIKETLNENVLVLFLLSDSFYHSKISLCEMGATWVKTNMHIPIVIPPFTFEDIEGVIIGTQGLEINNKGDINSLKDKITKLLNLDALNINIWEERRDEFLEKVNNIILQENSQDMQVKKDVQYFDIRKNLFKLFRSSEKNMMSTSDIYKLMEKEFDIKEKGYDMIDIYDYLSELDSEGKIKKFPFDNANLESMMWFSAL